jgi:hypothetical protein
VQFEALLRARLDTHFDLALVGLLGLLGRLRSALQVRRALGK